MEEPEIKLGALFVTHEPRGLTGLRPGCEGRGRGGDTGALVRAVAGCRAALCAVRLSREAGACQAGYTIVLMPLGLVLLLVGGGGAGGWPWWCTVCPTWAGWPWAWAP